MLSTLQTTLHWRRWSALVDANDWTMERSRLSPDSQRTAGLSIWHKLVWRAAEALALQAHRAITADDLRHACYLVATTNVPGWSKHARPIASMKDLDNRSFSRLLCLWGDGKAKTGLLIEPDCITSAIAWDHPDQDSAQWLVEKLARMAPDAVLRAISENAFGRRDWERLDPGAHRWLFRTLQERKARSNPKLETQNPQPAMSGIEHPF
jgi:hypothetical protein